MYGSVRLCEGDRRATAKLAAKAKRIRRGSGFMATALRTWVLRARSSSTGMPDSGIATPRPPDSYDGGFCSRRNTPAHRRHWQTAAGLPVSMAIPADGLGHREPTALDHEATATATELQRGRCDDRLNPPNMLATSIKPY